MDDNKAISKNLSFYQNDIDRINDFAKKTKRNFSEAIRYILDVFFIENRKTLRKDMLLHLMYPMVLCVIMLFGMISTENLTNLLIDKDIYFNELYLLNRTFGIIGFGTLSFFIANMYILFRKYKSKHG